VVAISKWFNCIGVDSLIADPHAPKVNLLTLTDYLKGVE